MPKINPNRMELLKLRRRERMARRGHKLLKDKLDALMKKFMALVAEARGKRVDIEDDLARAFGLLSLVRGEAGSVVTAEALSGAPSETVIGVGAANVLSVKVPVFSTPRAAPEFSYSLATTPALLDEAVGEFSTVLGRLVELAQVEKSIQLLAWEIEKTRRRVNALNHILIPRLDEAITYINMSLAEQERANTARIMKIKEMVEGGR